MTTRTTLRAGFVGTGYIAEYHLAAIRRAGGVQLVGVVDADSEKARQFAVLAGTQAFPDIEALRDAGAEVIHVLTPPHTHASVAQRALRAGCHVLVEKPLAIDVAECEAIRDVAEEMGRQVCVNHSLQFDPQVRKALAAVRGGKLGRVSGVDILRSSVYPPYPGGPLPPQYRSAGYPFRDLGVHALYLFQAFLGPIEKVTADWRSLGGDPNLAFDEWRAQVRCRDGLGHFQLSWNTKPLQSQIIIQGSKGVLRADLFLMTQAIRCALPVPKAAERIINGITDSLPVLVGMPVTVWRFLTGKALPYHGLQDLVRAFYDALRTGAPMPVSVDDAISVVHWVEEIARQADRDYAARVQQLERARAGACPGSILVTGASGNLGGAIARALEAQGERVRVMVRRPPDHVPDNVEVFVGNLGDPGAVNAAVEGARIVIHAGAATKGGWPDHECASVTGTWNVLQACRKFGIEKLVYISSMSVLDWAGAPPESVLDEAGSLEPRATERGAYTQAKLMAEQLVLEATRESGIATVILRPGKIFGGSAPLLSSAIGFRLGARWLVLGNGNVRIPFVHVDDVVNSVLLAMRSNLVRAEIIHILGKDQPTQNEVLRLCEGPGVKVLHIPRPVVFALGGLSQLVFKLLKRASPVAVYRLKSGLARRCFASRNSEALLRWTPKIGVAEYVSAGQVQVADTAGAPVVDKETSAQAKVTAASH